MKRKLSRKCIEVLAIQNAITFCHRIGILASSFNISMITGFSEEKIIEVLDTQFIGEETMKTPCIRGR